MVYHMHCDWTSFVKFINKNAKGAHSSDFVPFRTCLAAVMLFMKCKTLSMKISRTLGSVVCVMHTFWKVSILIDFINKTIFTVFIVCMLDYTTAVTTKPKFLLVNTSLELAFTNASLVFGFVSVYFVVSKTYYTKCIPSGALSRNTTPPWYPKWLSLE